MTNILQVGQSILQTSPSTDCDVYRVSISQPVSLTVLVTDTVLASASSYDGVLISFDKLDNDGTVAYTVADAYMLSTELTAVIATGVLPAGDYRIALQFTDSYDQYRISLV